MSALIRIGVAFTPERKGRRNEYALYQTDNGQLFVQYQGYREKTANGEQQVGLPFTGPNAVRHQAFSAFHRHLYEEVKLFGESHGKEEKEERTKEPGPEGSGPG